MNEAEIITTEAMSRVNARFEQFIATQMERLPYNAASLALMEAGLANIVYEECPFLPPKFKIAVDHNRQGEFHIHIDFLPHDYVEPVPPKPEPYKPRVVHREVMKSWEETMTADEVAFCLAEIERETTTFDVGCGTDNWRAARLWKSSQRRRFFKLKQDGGCGQHDFIVERWSREKKRFDLYLLGFDYGH